MPGNPIHESDLRGKELQCILGLSARNIWIESFLVLPGKLQNLEIDHRELNGQGKTGAELQIAVSFSPCPGVPKGGNDA